MAIHESVSRKLTYRDYLLFPEDGKRHELIDGEHFVAPATDREAARVYRQEGNRLALAQELSAAAGDVLETPLLPGLRIPLAEVFR